MQKETLKEYTRRFCEGCSNTQTYFKPPTDCQECLDAFVEAVDRLYTPKPSDDMSVPMENPYKDYLLFDKVEKQWFVGWYSDESGLFLWTTYNLCGDERLIPSHWLPMPPAPNA